MSNVIPFPQPRPRPLPWVRAQDKTSGIRVARFDGRWCVERLEAGDIIDRRFMPTQADAERIAIRICRRDRLTMLTARRSRPCPRPNFH
ncbi:hypothetical protein [Methylobacterium sp. E-046]|uniref:hypothetical protein n=1 Tax=Methylobacterium sp. E-046 TaxID=2836576 RepID=UPI001FBA50F1|nr:hypothetical protein [Methylobacterium sp. E-046]MCJ2097996.1 hypothetical protein [Methylobacterium sp. E-046]